MFTRLRCHYCGQRSSYSKGTTQFQCTSCEAYNFYDKQGNVVDTPEDFAATGAHTTQSTYQRSVQSPPPGPQQEDANTFCNRCRLNQKIYTETLANYLPDEDHPRYHEFEEQLPQVKADLERRYPLVCTNCAKKVQARIHEADYYGKTQHVAALMRNRGDARSPSPVGRRSRDDWHKWTMRLLLRLAGAAIYASLVAQIAWHLYGMAIASKSATSEGDEFAFDSSLRECAGRARSLQFDTACYSLFIWPVAKALLASVCLCWYNPGLISWYHPRRRISAIHGQRQHFVIEGILNAARALALLKLSDPTSTDSMSTERLLAAHGFMISFIALCQWLSHRSIKTELWRLKGTIMPRPDEVNIFAQTAGPAEEPYDRQASSVAPHQRLLQRSQKPFQIENLAPRQTQSMFGKLAGKLPPSPPDSQSVPSEDEMDGVEPTYTTTTQGLRSLHNYGTTQPLGWNNMRNELFSIDNSNRFARQRQQQGQQQSAKLRYEPQVNPSPFRGRLPPAPMSMERRLRNPPTQVSFKKQPVTKQQDFMRQMREGIERDRGFGKPKESSSSVYDSFATEQDEDFSPAKARTKGSLDLRPGSWTLKSDLDTATGLEAMFGGSSFRIADETIVNAAKEAEKRQGAKSISSPGWMVGGAVLAVGLAGWFYAPTRRAVCLWLVGLLEMMGY